MKINVIGLGYIGLPTAAMLAASCKFEVVGTDYKKEVIESLNSSKLELLEEGLTEVVEKGKQNGLVFTTEYQKADMYIVAVPTPYIKETKRVDAIYVINAIKEIINVCDKGSVVIIESTISPGTIERTVIPAIEELGWKAGEDIHIAHAPERIIPGNMVKELVNNSRIVGADEPQIGEKIKTVYESFCKGEIVLTNVKTAEMSKVVENTFRDINIAFANELAQICSQSGIDVYEVIKIANMHPRVNILQPGPGVGGHCISVDPWFLVGDYPETAKLIHQARCVNDDMPAYVIKKIKSIMEERHIEDFSKVGLYGMTYKEDVDDVRESPTFQLLENLSEVERQRIRVFDPVVSKRLVECQEDTFENFLEKVELVVIMVGHSHIKKAQTSLNGKTVLDCRNCIEKDNIYHL